MRRTAIVISCVLAARSTGVAQPAVVAPSCDGRLYLEPSLHVGFGTAAPQAEGLPKRNLGRVLDRIALGVLVPKCDSGARIRAGVTGFFSNFHWGRSDIQFGIGVELEADLPVLTDARVGLRLGAETMNGSRALLTVGGRYYVRDTVWFGLDGFVRLPDAKDDPSGLNSGVMVGVGATGKLGTVLGITELSIAATLGAIAVMLGAGGH